MQVVLLSVYSSPNHSMKCYMFILIYFKLNYNVKQILPKFDKNLLYYVWYATYQ